MSNNEQQQQTDDITNFANSYQGFLTALSNYLVRVRNVEYNTQTNTTKIYGHTNVEELKVNNTSVALAGHTHAISDVNGLGSALDGKAAANHNHDAAYAAAGHTHELAEVVRVYEEEEDFEEEEDDGNGGFVTVNKTRMVTKQQPLNEVLNGKANSVHEHSTADLTNWATATENFAKINTANTFTGTQTITATGTNADFLKCYNTNLATDSNFYIRLGQGDSTNLSHGFLKFFWYPDNHSATCFCLGMNGYDNLLQLFYNRTRIAKALTVNSTLTTTGTLTTPAITLNGNDLQTTLDGKASTNHNHDSSYSQLGHNHPLSEVVYEYEEEEDGELITKTKTLNEVLDGKANITHEHSTADVKAYWMVDVSTTPGQYEWEPHSASLLSFLQYTGDSLTIPVRLSVPTLWLDGIDLATTLNGKAASNHSHDATYASIRHTHNSLYAPLNHTHTLSDITDYQTPDLSNCAKLNTANTFTGNQTINGKIETTQTTAENSFGDNMKHAIFDLIYPIGSIYITNAFHSNVSVVDNKVLKVFYGCTFELLPPETFIKNINWKLSPVTGMFVTLEDAGGTGGNSTHTHNNTVSISNASHTLNVNQIPSHNHGTNVYIDYNSYNNGNPQGTHDNIALQSWATSRFCGGPNTTNTGNSQGHTHNNTVSISNASASSLPPYMTVYMWKRIA